MNIILKNRKNIVLISAIVIVLAFLIWIFAVFGTYLSQNIMEQSKTSVKDAVLRSAVQCYSVEGYFPDSLEYLEKNYGLVVNHNEYIVSYDAFSENLMPNVMILVKGQN